MEHQDNEQHTETVARPFADSVLSPEEEQEVYSRAIVRARARMAIYIHATAYVCVILLLVVINLLTSPKELWVVWPLFGWGLALGLHWFLSSRLIPVYEKLKSDEIARQLEAH